MPPGSKAPTFAACKLTINNERWAGVPFVLRAGKALNERGVLVRMQLHSHPAPLFGVHGDDMRNEFVMRLQPGLLVVCLFVVFGCLCVCCVGCVCVVCAATVVLFISHTNLLTTKTTKKPNRRGDLRQDGRQEARLGDGH